MAPSCTSQSSCLALSLPLGDSSPVFSPRSPPGARAWPRGHSRTATCPDMTARQPPRLGLCFAAVVAAVGCLWRPAFCLELKCSCGEEWGPTAHPQGLWSITVYDCHSAGGVLGPMEVLLPRALQAPARGPDPGTLLFPEQLLPGPCGKCVPVGLRREE